MGHHDRDMSNEIVGFRTVFSYLFISAAYLRMECNRNISVHDDAQRPDSKEISKSTVELLFLIFVGDVYYWRKIRFEVGYEFLKRKLNFLTKLSKWSRSLKIAFKQQYICLHTEVLPESRGCITLHPMRSYLHIDISILPERIREEEAMALLKRNYAEQKRSYATHHVATLRDVQPTVNQQTVLPTVAQYEVLLRK